MAEGDSQREAPWARAGGSNRIGGALVLRVGSQHGDGSIVMEAGDDQGERRPEKQLEGVARKESGQVLDAEQGEGAGERRSAAELWDAFVGRGQDCLGGDSQVLEREHPVVQEATSRCRLRGGRGVLT